MPAAADKRQYLTRQAVAAFQSGDAQTADRLFRRLATDRKADVQSQYNYGVFLRRSGRPSDALYWFDRCLRADPARRDVRIERGLARSELGNVSAAIDDLSAYPDDTDALQALPPLLARAGRWVEALDILARLGSIGAVRTDDQLLKLRGLLETGRVDDAETLCRSLGATRPELRPDLLKALTRRAKGRLSLDETRLARTIGG